MRSKAKVQQLIMKGSHTQFPRSADSSGDTYTRDVTLNFGPFFWSENRSVIICLQRTRGLRRNGFIAASFATSLRL